MISSCYCCAQTIEQFEDYTIITYPYYSLRADKITDTSTCSIKCNSGPTAETSLNIPVTVIINGVEHTVTSIPDNAFQNKYNFIGTLTLPNTITSIGKMAFQNCTGFTGSLVLPKSLGSAGNKAFENCKGFTSITIVDSEYHTNTIVGMDGLNYAVILTDFNSLPKKMRDFLNGLGVTIIEPGTTNTNVSAATFTPAAGSYTSSQYVTLSCETEGAKIYYSTNGSKPTEKDYQYVYNGERIVVDQNTTIKTYTYKNGYANTSQATYTIVEIIGTPVLSHNSSYDFYETTTVTATCDNMDAMYYTTDGTDPTTSDSQQLYENGISISENTTLKIVARKGTSYGSVVTESYHFHVYNPTFSDTNIDGSIKVTLNCETEDATIYYTIDGTDPITSDSRKIYDKENIDIVGTITIMAYAVKDDYEPSAVVTATYSEIKSVLAPTLSPSGGTFTGSTDVTISSEEGATIYYTTNGSIPTTASTKYTSAITLSEPTTIKAIAVKEGMINSEVSTGTYGFYISTPTFSIGTGTYNAVQNVNINCETEGVSIYYTTDGTTPTTESIKYTGTINITTTTNIKAIAMKDGWKNSEVVESQYTLKVPAITYTPGPNEQFSESVNVTLTCNDATIYYTTDGAIPTTESTKYEGAITITTTTNIKAIAVKDGWTSSDMIDLWYKEFITVGEPVFSPDNTEPFYEATEITITCSLPQTETEYTPQIYYTTDGSTPSTNSTVYNGGIRIEEPTTITAYGVVNDHDNVANSPIIAKKYDFKVYAPIITEGGTFSEPQTITLSCATSNAKIYYTTDGTTPSSNSIIYNGAIEVNANQTIKAIAVKEGWIDSDIVEATYELEVATPTITPGSCTFEGNGSITVSVNCTTQGATIHYTTDGSDPTPESTVCNGTITLYDTKTIKAIACKNGWNNSDIVSATYTEKEIVQAPILNLTPGTYNAPQSNTITCATDGATIYYTTDGTEPTTSSNTIESGKSISISQTTIIKAFACKDGMTNSNITTETYTFEVPLPTFSKPEGTYETTIEVELICATADKIYYTLDGTDPNNNSYLYSNPISIEKNTTIKAIAYKAGWNPSHITSASYAFLETVATPTFSHSSGEYKDNETINVTLKCETPGARIHYTTDGSTPDIYNDIYDGSIIEVSENTTIKAIAFKDGMKTSEIAVATYTFGTTSSNELVVFTGANINNPNKWYDPLNWNTGTVPSKTDRVLIVGDLVISSGEKIEIEYITNLKSPLYDRQGSITIKGSGQLVYNQYALENVKIEKEIAGYGEKTNSKGWYLISSPVAGPISNERYQSLTNNDSFYDLYLYDEATHYWINYKDNKFTNLSLGHGYLYANRNNVTITSVGIPNANDVYFILSAACPNTSDEPVLHDIDMKGFNLIGNPFTFNIGKGTNQAISNTYLESGYYTLSTTDGTWVPAQDSRPIGVGEGILVETANDGNDGAILTISKTPYVATSKTISASEETESLSIKVVNENYEDIAYVNFNNEKRGLRKIAHMNEDAQMVYVPANGVNYAIANMNTDIKEIPVSFEASTMGKYTISIDASKCNFEEIYLRDNFTGETVDIINEDHAFVATSSDKAERFTLLIANNNANEDSDIINQNFAYIHNGEIIISDVEGSGNVYVYDIMGRPVLTRHANGNVNIPASSLTGGIYIISLIDDNGIKTQKIAINK